MSESMNQWKKKKTHETEQWLRIAWLSVGDSVTVKRSKMFLAER